MEIGGNDEESQAMTSDDDEDHDERKSLVERVQQGQRSTVTRTAVRTHSAETARTHNRTKPSSQPYTSIRSKDNGEEGGMLNLFLWLGVAVVAALIVYNIQHLGEMEDTAAEEIQGQLKPSSSSSTTTYINTTTSNNNTGMALFTNDTSNTSTILHFP
jgi:hypothetical protein